MSHLNNENKGYLISMLLIISFALTLGLSKVMSKPTETTSNLKIESTPFDFDKYLDMTSPYLIRLYGNYIICLSGTDRPINIGISDIIYDPSIASFRRIEKGRVGTYIPHPISGELIPVYIREGTEIGKCSLLMKQRYSVPSVEFIEEIRGPYLDS